MLAFALLLGLACQPLHGLLYPGQTTAFSWEKLPLWSFLLVLVLPPLLGLFVGGLYKRFGRVGAYVLYFLFLGLCISTGGILDRVETLVDQGLGLPMAAAGAALLVVLTLLGTHWTLNSDN